MGTGRAPRLKSKKPASGRLESLSIVASNVDEPAQSEVSMEDQNQKKKAKKPDVKPIEQEEKKESKPKKINFFQETD